MKFRILKKELFNFVVGGCNVQVGDGDLSMKKYKIMINRYYFIVLYV